MTNQGYRKYLQGTTCAFLFTVVTPALAAVPSMLMPQFNVVEAGSVELTADPASGVGVAIARNCSTCPIQVKVDRETTFLVHGKTVSLRQALKHSLKPATVQYNKETQHALQITW